VRKELMMCKNVQFQRVLAFLPIAVTKSVIVVKSNEKAQDGEKDDNVACENEST